MADNRFAFVNHRVCEYFPCHKGLKDEEFNCLFCYCPLYFLGERCGGNFRILENGIKDCSNCLFPHKKDNYDKISAKMYEFILEDAACRLGKQQGDSQ